MRTSQQHPVLLEASSSVLTSQAVKSSENLKHVTHRENTLYHSMYAD